MKVSDGHKSSFKDTSKKAVSFDALETIERHSDNIDKLTSLVSKMNMKMDKHELSISHKFTKVEGKDRIDVITDKTIINPDINHTVGIGILHIEV